MAEESPGPLGIDLTTAEALRRDVPDPTTLEGLAEKARALADPTRLAIAITLARSGELCVCDLAWIAGRSDKLVSHHVRQLRSAGLVRSRRQGKMVMYVLTDEGSTLLAALA